MPEPQSRQSKKSLKKLMFSGTNKDNFPKIQDVPAIIKILNAKLNLKNRKH